MSRDYTSIGNWCIDAHSITASELSERIAQVRLEMIAKYAGKPPIVEIAKDLAEGLNDLTGSKRSAAQEFLTSRHGFGFDYFIKRDQLRLAKIIARGKVRNEKEHRAILDALSDTTLDRLLAAQLEALLVSHEAGLGAA
jgi:hypothetical protein